MSTKNTAAPMPIAVDVFFDVPRKGQMPRNCASITLFTSIVEISMIMIFMAQCYLEEFLILLTIAMR